MTAADWIARAHAVTDGATPGPWAFYECYPRVRSYVDMFAYAQVTNSERREDDRFIAASRTLLPAAVAAIEAVLGCEDVLSAEVGHQVYEATDLEPEECTDDCPACAIEAMFAAITAALDVTS